MIKRFFRGEFKLWIMFWIFFIPGLIIPGKIFGDLIYNYANNGNVKPLIAFSILTFVYQIIISIVTWKSASNYKGEKRWDILTKVVIFLYFFNLAKNSILVGVIP